MDKTQMIEAAQAAFKSKEVAAPVAGVATSAAAMVKGESVSWLSQVEPMLTVAVLALSAIWLVVQMWSRIALTRRTLASPASPASPVKEEGAEA